VTWPLLEHLLAILPSLPILSLSHIVSRDISTIGAVVGMEWSSILSPDSFFDLIYLTNLTVDVLWGKVRWLLMVFIVDNNFDSVVGRILRFGNCIIGSDTDLAPPNPRDFSNDLKSLPDISLPVPLPSPNPTPSTTATAVHGCKLVIIISCLFVHFR